jgi:hypothetical protein
MSQIKSKRKTSSAQFLETALQIQITTLRRVAKFPKRFTYLLSVHLTDAAARGFEQVKKANSIYPRNRHEAQIRRDCLIKAYAEYQHLISQILVAEEMFDASENGIVQWIKLINEELSLIKGLMDSDARRYRDLK